MKLERIEANLNKNGDYEYVTVKGRQGRQDSDCLLEYLRQGIRKQKIKSGNKIVNNNYTKYIFNVYTYDTNAEKDIKSLFVLKVKNSERSLYYSTLKSLDDLCELSVQIKKKNTTRIVAGITAGLFILVAAGPSIAKGIGNLIEKDYEYDQQRYSQYSDHFQENIEKILTEEQKEEAKNSYYDDLEKRAMAGDKEAVEEYNQYKLEQRLQYENEHQSKVR